MNSQLRDVGPTDVEDVEVDLSEWPVVTSWIDPGPARAWSWHRHAVGELLWNVRGAVRAEAGGATWIVPPHLGLWIPAGEVHRVYVASGASLACTFVSGPPAPARRVSLVDLSPVTREALRQLGEDDPRSHAGRARLAEVALAFVAPISGIPALPMPRDDRAREVADRLLADPVDDRPLADWAAACHTSERTLSRLFVTETGLTFGRWRTQLRLSRSLALLADGYAVEAVGERVGYQSASAFAAAFRRFVGVSPGTWVRSRTGTGVPLGQ